MDLQGKIINEKFRIIKKIAQGGMSDIWLAQNMEDNQSVVVKVLKKEAMSNRAENVARFRNEAITASKLDRPCIVKVYEIGEMDNTYYIVMEYLKGKSLQDIISEDHKFEIEEIVQIIEKICQALAYIHSTNIIHRDIKPSNIFINFSDNKNQTEIEAKLVDFGLAQIKEFKIEDTREIVGTLFYMSPEQSGILKKNVSESSDLYSLGIIFYQLLAGELPFTGEDISTILHQQIAKIPEPLSKFNADIPPSLEKIVLKLLEKEPEKRYQSADGLLHDLRNYRDFKNDFLPGLECGQITLNYKTELTGRDDELKSLKQLFNGTINKNGGICLISGEAGQGKTRLVEEFRKHISEKKYLFINAKCFIGEDKIPFNSLRHALTQYLKIFNKYPQEKKNTIKQYLRKVSNDLGEILVNFNPMMSDVLGECAPLAEFEPEKETSRFNMVIAQLFLNIAKIEHALVLHIDDMQWIDKGSIDIISELLKDISQTPLFLIGSYRNDEITSSNEMSSFIQLVEKNNYPLTKLRLLPFDEKRVNQFVAKLLHDTIENTAQISSFIFQKSKGNPNFAIEILKQLTDEKAIVLIDSKWAVDLGVLGKIEIPTSIADAIIKKVSTLTEEEVNVLSFAAAVGREFNIELLFILTEKDEDEVLRIVDKAIQLRILEEESGKMGEIAFLHNKIKEYFYNNISDDKKRKLHLKIANVIEVIQEFDKHGKDKKLFDLAYHYIEANNKDKILEYAYPAGLKAKENCAFDLAVKYLKLVAKILDSKNKTGSDKWIYCLETVGEIYLTVGKYDEAINTFSKILPFLKTNLGKSNAYKEISHAYLKKGEWISSEQFARKGLRFLGETLPTGKFQVIFSILRELLFRYLSRLFRHFWDTKRNQDRLNANKKIVQFYHILSWLYMRNDVFKCINSTFRMLNISESKIGESKELGLSLGVFASFTLIGFSFYEQAIKYHEKAIELKKEISDEWGIAQSLQLMAFCYEWKGDYRKSVQCYKQSIEKFKKIGDIGEVAMCKNGLAFSYYYLADYDNAITINNDYFKSASKSKDIYGIVNSWHKYLLCYIEKGEFEKAEQYGKKAYKLSRDLAQGVKDWLDYCITIIILGVLSLEKKDVKKSIEYLEEAREIYEKNDFIKQYTVFLYCHLANAYIYDYILKSSKLKKDEEKILLKKIKKACVSAVNKTKSLETCHMSSLRVYAKYYSLIDAHSKSENLFKKSIELSKKNERKFELGKSYYEYGKHLEKIGLFDESRETLQFAYNIFKDIGAKAYQKKAADLLGIDESISSNSEKFLKDLRYNQRLSSVISLGQDISSILDLNVLLQKVMTIAIQVTGATIGYLMFKDERTKEMIIRSSMNINENEEDRENYSQNIINIVCATGETVLTVNASEDENFNKFDSVIINQFKSVLCAPIKYNNELKGVCYLSNPLSSGVFKEEDKDILNVLMGQAAISFENANLYKMAITDGLTGLITHKHFKFMLSKEIERTQRNESVFSLILFDIDFFKKFNDTYGHQAGDLVLMKVADITRDVFRSIDVLARYGGEEFIVILPDTDSEGTKVVAERLRSAIEESELVYQGIPLKVTISIGVASYPTNAIDGENLIKLADQALYSSKEAGRNRVTIA